MRENISAFINSRRYIAVFAILTIMFGGLWMAHTQMNRIPDLWEHVYRVSGITNGDIVARPVTSVSDYHRIAADNYGGKVDWQWINLISAPMSPITTPPSTPQYHTYRKYLDSFLESISGSEQPPPITCRSPSCCSYTPS